MLANLSIFPTDKGPSVSPYVARAVAVIERSGLPFQVTAMGTLFEGEPDAVFALLRECHDALLADCDRVYMVVTLDHRKGSSDRLLGKVASIEEKLGHAPRR